MDLEALRIFVTVCQEKKMSRAADKLFMSKQALSTTIKKIEMELDATLLIRTSTGVKLTPEGQCFFEYAQRMLSTWVQCTESLARMKRDKRTTLLVSFAYMSWNLWISGSDAAFARENPHIALSTEIGLSKDLLLRMDEGKTDMVITCMQTDRHSQYDREKICTAKMCLLMTAEDPLAPLERLRPADLAGRAVLYPDSGAAFFNQFCRFMEGIGCAVEPRLVPAGNYLAHLRTLRDEHALLLSNRMYQSLMPAVDGYVNKEMDFGEARDAPVVTIWALMPRAERRNPAADCLIDFLRRRLLPLSAEPNTPHPASPENA